jgi:hypothetical protein
VSFDVRTKQENRTKKKTTELKKNKNFNQNQTISPPRTERYKKKHKKKR